MQFRKEEADNQKKAEDASISSKHKTMAKQDFSEMSPKDFDLATEEGREGWENYKRALKSH